MKRSEFNRMFGNIHWDESKRLNIEAMLIRPCQQPESERKAQKEEVFYMPLQKMDRKPSHGKKMTAAVLSACAVFGIIAGTFALLNRGNDPNFHESNPSEHGNSTSSGSTESPFKFVADNVQGDLQTKFEGPENVPSMTVSYSQLYQSDGDGQLLATESGWYCSPLYSGGCGMTIYVDEATGQHTPLCSRPECTHDTEYCEANNSQFFGIPYTYYDGYLYGVASDQSTSSFGNPVVGETVYATDRGDICLMRYAPDGTELTKLCKLQDALQESIDHTGIVSAEIIGHKGALWISVQFDLQYGIMESHEYTDPFTGELETTTVAHITEYSTAYALFHYDIARDTLTAVIEVPLTKSQTPFSAPTHLCASGDYLYFRKTNCNWADPYNGDLIYRVNIRTGAMEEVANAAYTTFALSSTKLVYMTYADGYYDADKRNIVPCILDLQTGEEKLLFEDTDVFYTDVQCTAEYIILTKNSPLAEIEIYDWQGNLLATLKQPTQEFPGELGMEVLPEFVASIAINGDRLYGQCFHGLYYLSLSEAIAAGTAKWNTAYDAFALQDAYMSYAETD